MSLFSSSDPKNNSTKLVWRIDSAGIAVTVIDQSTQKIQYYDFQPIVLSVSDERHVHEQLMHHTELCIKRILPGLQSVLSTRPDRAIIILGEPWAHSIRRTMVYKRKTPFKLTRSFVSDLVDRDMKRLTQQQTSKYRHAIKLLPPTYHTMRISGHDRPNAWGTSINDLAFDYFTGFSDDNMSKMVTAFVHEKLKVPLLHINVDHYQNYVMRFWQQAKPSEGLVVDPSGYVTDLYIFQNGTMLQVGTLPVGLSGIRAKLSTQLGIYPGELNSLLALYGKNLLDESTHEKLSKLMSELYQAWEKDFQTFCHHAVGQGDILDYVIWSGNQNDPLLQFFMHAVSSNTLQFPLVFGASRVGFMHVDLLLDVMGQDMRQYPQMQNYDRIIIVGMANK